MHTLELTIIGRVPTLTDLQTGKRTPFKNGFQDVVVYINRFKIADTVKGLHLLPSFFYGQLNPAPISPVITEAHAAQFLNTDNL